MAKRPAPKRKPTRGAAPKPAVKKKPSAPKASAAKRPAPSGRAASEPRPSPRPSSPSGGGNDRARGQYTPGEIQGIGWRPFRYPPE